MLSAMCERLGVSGNRSTSVIRKVNDIELWGLDFVCMERHHLSVSEGLGLAHPKIVGTFHSQSFVIRHNPFLYGTHTHLHWYISWAPRSSSKTNNPAPAKRKEKRQLYTIIIRNQIPRYPR